jgi:hypothetical protein
MRIGRRGWHRLEGIVAGVACLVAGAALCGWCGLLGHATAQSGQAPANPSALATEAAGRPAAYIYGSQVITRGMLGEYLIARQGSERLELLVNKMIIDQECQKRGVQVTAAEIEASLADDLKGMGGLKQSEFVNNVLKRYSKTLYEWKEDVIRPRLQLTKLCKDQVKVEDEDLQHAFEAHYGEKVHCKLIMWPPSPENLRNAQDVWAKIRDNDAEFDRVAKMQASPQLANKAGEIEPFGHFTTGNAQLEKAAFGLKPGEVSEIIQAPEGYVVIKLLNRVPPDTSKKLAEVREALSKEVYDKKLQATIPQYFARLRAAANPKLLLQKAYVNEEEWLRDIGEQLSDSPSASAPRHMTPQGN